MSDNEEFNKNCNLFISNLPTQDRAVIFEYLKKQSPKVVSVGVKPGIGTKSSAYVSCEDHKSAEELIEKLNGQDYKGNKLVVAWVVKDLNKDDKNVVVNGLKKEITTSDLWKEFEKYGKVLSAKVSVGPNNQSNGYGYVRFVLDETCNKVLEEETMKQISNNIGTETFSIQKYVRRETKKKTNLYVSNINKSVTEEEFVKYFEQFGELSKPNNHMYISGKEYNTNIGYINFENPESASKAISESNGKNVLNSNNLSVVYFLTKEERRLKLVKEKEERNNKLRNEYADFNLYFIKEDGEPIDEKEFFKTFEDIKDDIYSFHIKRDAERKPTNICYVCMNSYPSTRKMKLIASDRGFNVSQYKNGIQNVMMFNMLFPYPMGTVRPPFYYPYPYPNNGNVYRPKPKPKPKPEPVKVVVTEEMKNALGEQVYDSIIEFKFDEETAGRVTGILLESYDYKELLRMSKDPKKLQNIAKDVVDKLNNNNNNK